MTCNLLRQSRKSHFTSDFSVVHVSWVGCVVLRHLIIWRRLTAPGSDRRGSVVGPVRLAFPAQFFKNSVVPYVPRDS